MPWPSSIWATCWTNCSVSPKPSRPTAPPFALVPHYGDAHYNVALAYERTGDRRAALRHWTTYIKLDPVGPWSNHARMQARKILEREKLSIVHRGSSVSHE